MEKLVRQGLLFDTYGELLTKRQRQIYEDVVYGDLSLSEAGETYGISRQGVHDHIKRCDRILEEYEEKLRIIERRERIEGLAREALSIIDDNRDLKPHDREIRKLLESILQE